MTTNTNGWLEKAMSGVSLVTVLALFYWVGTFKGHTEEKLEDLEKVEVEVAEVRDRTIRLEANQQTIKENQKKQDEKLDRILEKLSEDD